MKANVSTKKQLLCMTLMLIVIFCSLIPSVIEFKRYTSLINETSQEIVKETNEKLNMYSNSDDYIFLNPKLDLYSSSFQFKVNDEIKDVELISNLYADLEDLNKYVYVMKKTIDNKYEIVEIYNGISEKDDGEYEISYVLNKIPGEAYRYKNDKLIEFQQKDFNDRLSSEQVVNKSFGKPWFIATVLIMLLGVILITKFGFM